MKKIANILYENSTELTNHTKLDWINYIRYVPINGLTDVAVNYKLPTLFIGWNNYKRIFNHLYPNVLVKKSNTQHPFYWEFNINEKITDHFTGIENFIKQAPKMYIDTFKYSSIDPIKNNVQDVEHLFRSLGVIMGSYYQYKEDIIYVHNLFQDSICGIYLNAFKYFGFDVNEITTHFAKSFKNKTIDSDGLIYQSYYKQFPDFDQLKRTMVLFIE